MKATAPYLGKVLPCKRLIMISKFFNMPSDDVRQIYHEFYCLVNQWFKEYCVMDWTNEKHHVIKEDDIDSLAEDGMMEICGNAYSDLIHNKTSMKAYKAMLMDGLHFPMGYSDDYHDYYMKNIMPFLKKPEELQKALIRLFSEDGREYADYEEMDNVYGGITSCPEIYSNNICGEMNLSVSCFFLDSMVDEFAEKMYEFTRSLSGRFSNISSTVFIGTDCDDSRCFQVSIKKNEKDTIRGYPLSALANDRYLQNVGWSTILSPATVKLLGPETDLLDYSGEKYRIGELPNGSLSIKLNCKASATKMADLKEIRKMVYPALSPGKSWFEITDRFRCRWETIPVLDEEIEVLENRVIIGHHGSVNLDYLFPEKAVYDSLFEIVTLWSSQLRGYMFNGIARAFVHIFIKEFTAEKRMTEFRCRKLIEEYVFFSHMFNKKEREKILNSIDSLIKPLTEEFNNLLVNKTSNKKAKGKSEERETEPAYSGQFIVL